MKKRILAWVLSLAIAITFMPVIGDAAFAAEGDPAFTIYYTDFENQATDVSEMKVAKSFTMEELKALAAENTADFRALKVKGTNFLASGAKAGDYVCIDQMVDVINAKSKVIDEDQISMISGWGGDIDGIYTKVNFAAYYGTEAYFGADTKVNEAGDDIVFAKAESEKPTPGVAISLKLVDGNNAFTQDKTAAQAFEEGTSSEAFGTTICGSIPDSDNPEKMTTGGNRFAKGQIGMIFYIITDPMNIKNAEDAIKAIGTVNYTKKAKITAATEAYNLLNTVEKDKVDATLVAKLQKAQKIINAIPTTKATVKVTNIKTKSLKATWGAVSKAKGYQVVVAKNSKFTKGKKVYNVTAKNKTVKKLKKGQKYYVKVRAYGKYNGVKYYGPWSAVKYVKIKK